MIGPWVATAARMSVPALLTFISSSRRLAPNFVVDSARPRANRMYCKKLSASGTRSYVASWMIDQYAPASVLYRKARYIARM